jgi:hypothetical protein
MKNIFKFFLVCVVVLVLQYSFWALACFIFTGEFLGTISSETATGIFSVKYIIFMIASLTYLNSETQFFKL